MRNFIYLLIVVLGMTFLTSCESVESGHRGEVSFGGKTNMDNSWGRFKHGIDWLWDNIVSYDVREKRLLKSLSSMIKIIWLHLLLYQLIIGLMQQSNIFNYW